MEPVAETAATASPQSASAPMSPVARAIAIFTRPTQAWSGLETRAQWWFPTLIVTLIAMIGNVLIYNRAVLPMMLNQWETAVQNGTMSAKQFQDMEQFMSGRMGMVVSVAPVAVILPISILLIGLVVWFGAGFVLGRSFRYRHALEVAAWSSLVSVPGQILGLVLAWIHESVRGIHTGFGVLIPDSDPPSKLLSGLAAFLDGLGPLALWSVAVAIIGASALSGAPRKQVAWVLGGLYVALLALFCALGALFGQAA